MKISTNPVGNYSPHYMRNAAAVSKPAVNTGSAEIPVKAKQVNITKDEKTFFANMYPNSKAEISDYHFYQRSGKMSGVSVGSLIDKRG